MSVLGSQPCDRRAIGALGTTPWFLHLPDTLKTHDDHRRSRARLPSTVSKLSVSFEDEEEHGPDAQDDYDEYEDKTPAPEPGVVTPETATLSSGLSGATKPLSRNPTAELDDVVGPDPDYDDFIDGTEGSKPSVASAKRSALLNAPRPSMNGYTPAAKRVFNRVEALMKNDEWMQLFKP
ncbi:hypothetical protein PC110_g12855, partial [Phytophthora cactorum]